MFKESINAKQDHHWSHNDYSKDHYNVECASLFAKASVTILMLLLHMATVALAWPRQF